MSGRGFKKIYIGAATKKQKKLYGTTDVNPIKHS